MAASVVGRTTFPHHCRHACLPHLKYSRVPANSYLIQIPFCLALLHAQSTATCHARFRTELQRGFTHRWKIATTPHHIAAQILRLSLQRAVYEEVLDD